MEHESLLQWRTRFFFFQDVTYAPEKENIAAQMRHLSRKVCTGTKFGLFQFYTAWTNFFVELHTSSWDLFLAQWRCFLGLFEQGFKLSLEQQPTLLMNGVLRLTPHICSPESERDGMGDIVEERSLRPRRRLFRLGASSPLPPGPPVRPPGELLISTPASTPTRALFKPNRIITNIWEKISKFHAWYTLLLTGGKKQSNSF